jgi:excisionase family DNA binding protein
MQQTTKKLLTSVEAGELLGVTRQYVGKLIKSGKLVGELRGRDWLVTSGSVNKLRPKLQAQREARKQKQEQEQQNN